MTLKTIITVSVLILVMHVFIVSSLHLAAVDDEEGRKKKIGGKKGSNLYPLLLIPFLIQIKIIPLILFQMKLAVTKALILGKLAILIILMNVIRNAILGTDYAGEQYEMQTLATQHYGYNGGLEYGAWINRRRKRRIWKRQQQR